MKMVLTILEAHVPADKWAALEQAYRSGIAQLDPGITQTDLVHGFADPTVYRHAAPFEKKTWRSHFAGSG